MGRSDHTFIYEGRLVKDHAFAQSHLLYYLLWHHHADTADAATDHDLRTLFLENLLGIYCVAFADILEIAQSTSRTKLNSKYGHSDTNLAYGHGYRLPLNRILTRPHLNLLDDFPLETLFRL